MIDGLGDIPGPDKALVLSSWKLAAVVFAAGGITMRLPSIATSGRPTSVDWPICGAGEAVVLPLDPPTWMVIFFEPTTGVS